MSFIIVAMTHPKLPLLDSSLYPFVWQDSDMQGVVDSPQQILYMIAMGNQPLSTQVYQEQLYANETYQQWINFTVFGRYVQRSFAAFYRQSEDSFNSNMPDLLRHELMRHAQYLPMTQTLFFGGELPRTARQEKLFSTTLNPFTAWQQAQDNPALLPSRQRCVFINLLQIASHKVLGFAVRHNKRTSERLQSEVMILNFSDLRLISEQSLCQARETSTDSDQFMPSMPVFLRRYEIR
ncbi:hypothetical protein [Psychrobacter sp. I-STPA10]|uniref:hypothetical protein n=1 Tax=Psychrobacter sp. I-STPA10 TaxID=2585769 RepID=UPI001E628D52|nr:hypothetical protein [Psychrobacter sp. I-STPA10]